MTITGRLLGLAAVLTVALTVLAGGCGDPASPPEAGVHGTVTFRGRPLAGGVIVFAPDRDRGTPGRPLTAALDDEGHYRLERDGSPRIPPGRYSIAIAGPPVRYGADVGDEFPAALRRPDRSGLHRDVHAGQDHQIDFQIAWDE